MPHEAACNRSDLAKLGWLGEDSPHILNIVDGVEVRRHPQVMLAEHPELWILVDQFVCGVRRSLSVKDYDALSNFAFTALRTMDNAYARESSRARETDNESED